MSTNTTWLDPRTDPPAERTMYFFRTTSEELVLIGYFLAPIPGHACSEGYLGHFIEGIWHDYRPLRGIGYNVWAQNEYEVTHYKPLIFPAFNKAEFQRTPSHDPVIFNEVFEGLGITWSPGVHTFKTS